MESAPTAVTRTTAGGPARARWDRWLQAITGSRRWRDRSLSELLAIDRGVLVQALKIALSAGLAWALAGWLLSSPSPIWAPITASLMALLTVRASIRDAIEKIVAVVIGIGVAIWLGGLIGLHAWSIARDRRRWLPDRQGAAAQRWGGRADPDQRPVRPRPGSGHRPGGPAVPGHADRGGRRGAGELRRRAAELRWQRHPVRRRVRRQPGRGARGHRRRHRLALDRSRRRPVGCAPRASRAASPGRPNPTWRRPRSR